MVQNHTCFRDHFSKSIPKKSILDTYEREKEQLTNIYIYIKGLQYFIPKQVIFLLFTMHNYMPSEQLYDYFSFVKITGINCQQPKSQALGFILKARSLTRISFLINFKMNKKVDLKRAR